MKLLIIAALAALVAVLLAQTVFGEAKKVEIGDGSVAALNRTARAADALPADVLRLPFAAHNFATANGTGSRLLKVDGSSKIFAIPGKASLLCVVEIDSAAQTAGGGCADRKVLLTGSIWTAEVREDGTKDVVGLVGDGHTYAEAEGRRVPVENNLFVLRGVEGDELTIGSPTAAQSLEIGG